jgi:L-asparaginase II
MMTHPEMVAGEGRFDTVLMRAGHGRWIAKAGAEGYQLIGVRTGAAGRGAPALGIALKVSDGDTTMRTEPLGESPARAAPLVAIEVLRQLRLLDEEDQVALAGFDQRPLTNWRALATGEIRPAFVLD